MDSTGTIAVVGVGAVGGALAAHLCTAGHRDLVLCVRARFQGLVVDTPRGTLQAAPVQVVAPGEVGPVRWLLLATKAHDTAGASAWLRALATPRTTIAILQNGVEHAERVATHANGAELVPVVVECPAARVAPGRIVQRAPAELVVPSSDSGREFARLFQDTAVRVTPVDDFRTAAWRKLCVNVAGGAITALTDRTLGVAREPAIAELARGLVAECVAVGRAEGALLDSGLVEEIVAGLEASPPDAGTSMLADRRAGRRLEVDARNGAVARIGARHGIATPLNRAVTALLAAVGSG